VDDHYRLSDGRGRCPGYHPALCQSGRTLLNKPGSIIVTAVGWAPTGITSAALESNPAILAASGEGFVVGGIYELQPNDLTMNPAASLMITYTDAAVAGFDESKIGMFRWNPDQNNWQPLAAQSDLANNTFTASITQLGTFALGYDDIPPQIVLLAPVNGSTLETNQL